MRNAQGFHTYAASSGVPAAYDRNPLYVTVPRSAYEMDRQQMYYTQQQHQAYIPMQQSYASGPPLKIQSPPVYLPTHTQAVRYGGQQPIYVVGTDLPPEEEGQDCVAMRRCWANVPQAYRLPFLLGIGFLILLFIIFIIAFFVTSMGGHYDY